MQDEGMGLRQRKKLATWQAIRDAAVALIDERGYDAVSLDEIAQAAGVARTTLFNYFASKEAIILDPAPQDFECWRSLIAERPQGEALWESLQAICCGYLGTFASRLAAQKQLRELSPALADSSREHAAPFKAELRDWVTKRTAPGDEVYATLAVNTAYAVMATAYNLWSPTDSSDRLMDLLHACFEQAGAGLAMR
ncbi:TetR/AcrR family transcriptional regulator [Streptomyces sp. CA-100214]